MKRNCEECGTEFEVKPLAIHQKFCSRRCRSLVQRRRKKQGLGYTEIYDEPNPQPTQSKLFELNPKPIEPVAPPMAPKAPTAMKKEKEKSDDEPITRRQQIPVPQGLDTTSSFIFSLQNREIDRFESQYLEERKKRKQLKDQMEKAREELAELKTENKIKAIEAEHKKPGALDGIKDTMSGLMENQYVGPVIAQFLGNILNSSGVAQLQGPAVDDPEAQQAIIEIVNWYAIQSKDTQKAYKSLMDLMAGVQDPAQLADLISRLTFLVKDGSTIHRGDAGASMSYGT